MKERRKFVALSLALGDQRRPRWTPDGTAAFELRGKRAKTDEGQKR